MQEVRIEDLRVVSSRGAVAISAGEPASLYEGERIELHANLKKVGSVQGAIVLSSGLLQVEGLTRFNLSDYRQPQIPIDLRGTVPDALVRDGKVVRIGETRFTLLTILVEDEDGVRTLLNVDAIATTPLLEQSKAEIGRLSSLLLESESRTRTEAASVLDAARQVWEEGDPELALSLCRLAEKILGIEVNVVDLPWWYPTILVLAILAAACGWFAFVRKGRRETPDFSLKPRRW
jgi:hypothetical protein